MRVLELSLDLAGGGHGVGVRPVHDRLQELVGLALG